MRGMRKGDEASAGTLPTLAGIVLAAGAGERMGGPKALLLVQGEPLARLMCGGFARPGARRS